MTYAVTRARDIPARARCFMSHELSTSGIIIVTSLNRCLVQRGMAAPWRGPDRWRTDMQLGKKEEERRKLERMRRPRQKRATVLETVAEQAPASLHANMSDSKSDARAEARNAEAGAKAGAGARAEARNAARARIQQEASTGHTHVHFLGQHARPPVRVVGVSKSGSLQTASGGSCALSDEGRAWVFCVPPAAAPVVHRWHLHSEREWPILPVTRTLAELRDGTERRSAAFDDDGAVSVADSDASYFTARWLPLDLL